MAEALAIAGSVAAILQVSEFTGKVIYTAYGLYSSVSGFTTKNESIESVTLKLKDLLGEMQTQMTSAMTDQGDQNARLSSLVKSCSSLGQSLLEKLEKTKTKKFTSLHENLKASMKTIWTKDDIEDLTRQLDVCVNELGLYLVATFRSETGEKLEKLLAGNSSQKLEIAILHQTLAKIEVDQKLAFESSGFLRELFSSSDSILRRINRDRILKGLAFKGMGRRYQEVASSAADTFKWCLEDLEVPALHPVLKLSFRDWLVRGKGIYHISGKPGAGKSTLMRFIVENDATKGYLKDWAKSRALVVASFFFWKPGERLQKNLEGLMRSIVHSILSAAPEMIPIVFPQFLDPRAGMQLQVTTDIAITSREVSAAFDKLIEDIGIMKDYCFCFFIDGLDEFDDPSEHHAALVLRLQSWTDHNSETVKICVSSREENSFMINLPVSQRLRLHLLTRNDMAKSVRLSLSKHRNFTANLLEDRQAFVEEVVKKADGVFLWRLEETPNTLKHMPSKLGELFSGMLMSIDPDDQKEAWAVVAILVAVHEHRQEHLTILDYSFVKEILETTTSPLELALTPIAKSELLRQQNDFALHIHRALKGLVEVDYTESISDRHFLEDYGLPKEKSSYYSFQGSLKVTHRSIYEFLEAGCPEKMKAYIDTLDSQTIVLRCMTLRLTRVSWDILMNQNIDWGLDICLQWVQDSGNDEHFQLLATVDDLLMYAQNAGNRTDGIDWSKMQEFTKPSHIYTGRPNRLLLSVLAFSFCRHHDRYVRWVFVHLPATFAEDRTRAELCKLLFWDVDEMLTDAFVPFLFQLIDLGLLSSHLLNLKLGLRPWQDYIRGNFISNAGSYIITWRHIQRIRLQEIFEIMLRFQVNPRVVVFEIGVLSTDVGALLLEQVEMTLKIQNTQYSSFAEVISIDREFYKTLKPKMSLRDLIEWWNPDNCVDLLRLIDWNLARLETKPIPGAWIEEDSEITFPDSVTKLRRS